MGSKLFWRHYRAGFPAILAQQCSNKNMQILFVEELQWREMKGTYISTGRERQRWVDIHSGAMLGCELLPIALRQPLVDGCGQESNDVMFSDQGGAKAICRVSEIQDGCSNGLLGRGHSKFQGDDYPSSRWEKRHLGWLRTSGRAGEFLHRCFCFWFCECHSLWKGAQKALQSSSGVTQSHYCATKMAQILPENMGLRCRTWQLPCNPFLNLPQEMQTGRQCYLQVQSQRSWGFYLWFCGGWGYQL